MSVIKQISIFNGTNWDTPANIGANAENVDFTYTTGSQAGNTAALSSILPAQALTASRVLVTDSNGKLSSSSISSGVLNTALSGASTVSSLQSQINNNLVHKTGDTMTGNLAFNAVHSNFNSSNLTRNTMTSQLTFGNGRIDFFDSNNNIIAAVRPTANTTYQGIELVSFRDSDTANSLVLGFNNDGNRIVRLTEQGAWRDILNVYSKTEIDNKISNVQAHASNGNATKIYVKASRTGSAYGSALVVNNSYFWHVEFNPSSPKITKLIGGSGTGTITYNSSDLTFTITCPVTGQAVIWAGGGVGASGTITFGS